MSIAALAQHGAETEPVEALAAYREIRAGDVLRRQGERYQTRDGRSLPAWSVAFWWGRVFRPIRGQMEWRLG